LGCATPLALRAISPVRGEKFSYLAESYLLPEISPPRGRKLKRGLTERKIIL